MRLYALFFSVLFFVSGAMCQSGCTDIKASNYNAAATSNNGSCTYPATSIYLTNVADLPAILNESSALISANEELWTLNDSGNGPQLFKINSTDGSILQTVTVTNAVNKDWEELTADANYFYIGDFGNNASGDRTDLRVYRVLRSDIGTGTTVNVTAAVIAFVYPDQVISGPSAANSTKFDCEAFLIKDNILHLFTKDWTSGHTQHYSLPSAPGSYTATKLDEFNAQGLVTGASLDANNEIILIGYTTNYLDLFMWLLYDYSGDNFFSGNRRKLSLGHSIDFASRTDDKGQTEGVTFTSNGNGYVSSEKVDRNIFGTQYTVPARLYSFSISSLLTLPVKLISFKATYINPDVRITWQTASEINSAFYSVERSVDAVHFSQLNKQRAAGNSDQVNDYRYTDKAPMEGLNYYRLVQQDIDGKSTAYLTRSVHAGNQKSAALHVFDTNGTLIIETSKNSPGTAYQIMNINGTSLLKGKIVTQKQQVNLNALPKGNYIVKLSSGETARFVK